VLHHRHEFDVCEAHLLDVVSEQRRQLPVAEPAVSLLRDASQEPRCTSYIDIGASRPFREARAAIQPASPHS